MTKCLVKLTYYDFSIKKHYYKYHVMNLDLDKSVSSQIYDKYGHLIPTFTDFKWQEIKL